MSLINLVNRVPQGCFTARYVHQRFASYLSADDTKVFFNSLNFYELARLQKWNTGNEMIENLSKTKCLPIAGHPNIYFDTSEPLENFQLQKDLGTFIAGDLKRPNQVNIEFTKVRKGFYSLQSRIPFKTPSMRKFILFNSMVLSILLYCIPACIQISPEWKSSTVCKSRASDAFLNLQKLLSKDAMKLTSDRYY